MGRIGFTELQNQVFSSVAHSKLAKQFYFTGGTALSVFYLKHRESEDLDFFSEEDFSNEPVIDLMSQISQKLNLRYIFNQKYKSRIFELKNREDTLLKVDFNHYPYKRVEKGTEREGVTIDSLRDIAGNKLLTINQRNTIKDFVDLYFLLKDHFTIWDLLYVVEAKFRMQLDLFMVSSDFLKVEEFDFLPKMLVPLSNKELSSFFREQAIMIGKRVTE